jgi:hypothetical protein
VQPRRTLDLDHPVGVHTDDCAHLLQQADQVDDLRLDGRVAQLGHPSAMTAASSTCSVAPTLGTAGRASCRASRWVR